MCAETDANLQAEAAADSSNLAGFLHKRTPPKDRLVERRGGERSSRKEEVDAVCSLLRCDTAGEGAERETRVPPPNEWAPAALFPSRD